MMQGFNQTLSHFLGSFETFYATAVANDFFVFTKRAYRMIYDYLRSDPFRDFHKWIQRDFMAKYLARKSQLLSDGIEDWERYMLLRTDFDGPDSYELNLVNTAWMQYYHTCRDTYKHFEQSLSASDTRPIRKPRCLIKRSASPKYIRQVRIEVHLPEEKHPHEAPLKRVEPAYVKPVKPRPAGLPSRAPSRKGSLVRSKFLRK